MKNNRTTTASTNVEYVVTASYEWSVPSKITFTDTIAEVEANADTGDTQKVKVTKNIIPNKKKLQITVSSTTTKEEGGVTKFAIKTDEDAYLIYAIKKGTTYDDEIAVGGEVMSVDSGKYAADTPAEVFLDKGYWYKCVRKSGQLLWRSSLYGTVGCCHLTHPPT